MRDKLPQDFAPEEDESEKLLAEMSDSRRSTLAEPQPQTALMIDKTPDGRSLVPPKSLNNFDAPREAEADEPQAPQPEIRLTAVEANRAVFTAKTNLAKRR